MADNVTTETTPVVEAPKITRASDLAALPDDQLLKEFGLASTQTPGTGDRGAVSEGTNTSLATDGGVVNEDGTQAEPGKVESDQGGVREETTAEGAAEAAAQAGAKEKAQEEAAKESPKLQAQFQVFEGEEELEIPSLTLKFKAAGEERELPLDRVVKLAQQGYYNEQRAEEMRQFREQLPQIEDTISALQQEREMLLQGWRRVLSGDEDYLAQQQQEFLREQSPEARAQRLEQELARERGQTRETQYQRQAAGFVQGRLVPTLQELDEQHPEVSFEEIIGRFNLMTAPLMVNGQIPPARFSQVESMIESELRPWVDTQNEKRAQGKKAQTTVVERATAQAAAAKRQTARAVMPQGTQSTGAEKAVNKPYKTAADILEDIPNILAPKTP